jgi:hypothetical protein
VSLKHFYCFNREGLDQLCLSVGLKNELTIADFPIDFNLFNPDTNSVNDKSKGAMFILHELHVKICLPKYPYPKRLIYIKR